MGAAVNRWLARPPALPRLRPWVHRSSAHGHVWQDVDGSRRFLAREHGTAVTSAERENENEDANVPNLRIRRALSHGELGLRMSLKTGVPIIDSSVSTQATFGELHRQADVNNDKRFGTLLVDQAEYCQNARLWVELLEFRQRVHGLHGVVDVWCGLRRRGFDLPVSGAQADILWPTFIQAGIDGQRGAGRDLLSELLEYAKDLKSRHNVSYPSLHKCIVGHWLRVRPGYAGAWHAKLVKADLVPFEALKAVAVEAMFHDDAATASHRREWFLKMYKKGSARDLYDYCMNEVLKRVADERVRYWWHSMFLRYGDRPSPDMSTRQDVQRLFARDEAGNTGPRPSRENDQAKKLMDVSSPSPHFPPLTRATMSTLVGDVHGIKAKEFSDSFIAKMFATRAFSLDLVIRGLSFFAIGRIGPLALREMALRAGSRVEFYNKLGELRGLGIQLSDAAFCRILQRLGSEGQTALFQALLTSDQHPEAYDDVETQQALLTEFLDRGDWMQAHITLFGLSLAGATLQGRALNLLLQHYLRTNEWRLLAQTMHTAEAQKVPLETTTLTYLHRYLLPERRRAKRPIETQRQTKSPFVPLDFTTSAYMYSAQLSDNVGPRQWVEILKRYGMTNRWGGLEKLVLWLVERYSGPRYRVPQQRADILTLATWRQRKQIRKLRTTGPLIAIFSRQMQMAIVAWGFGHAHVKHQLCPQPYGPETRSSSADIEMSTGQHVKPEPWAKGIVLLQRLRLRGVPVHDSVLRRAVILRLRVLFGPGRSTLKINQEMRKRNVLSLADYVRHANEIGELLLVKPALLDRDDLQDEERLMGAVLRQDKTMTSQDVPHADLARRAKVIAAHPMHNTEHYGNVDPQPWLDYLEKPGSSHVHLFLPALPPHRPPAARSESSHPPPSQLDTRALP